MKGRQAIMWIVGLAVLGLFVTASFAQDEEGQAVAPDEKGDVSSATAGPQDVYLPLVSYAVKPVTTLPFRDDFAGGVIDPGWQVYMPPISTEPFAWTSGPGGGRGIYYYDYPRGTNWKDWALSMYAGEGAQWWTDYRIVASVKDSQAASESGGLAGIWFRGTYENGVLGGYYAVIKRRINEVELWRLPPGSDELSDATRLYHDLYKPGISGGKFYNLKVEVRGANIQVWLKEQGAPDSTYRLAFNKVDDSPYLRGTVGLIAFKATAVFDDITVTPLE
jgi:hypothetical protein